MEKTTNEANPVRVIGATYQFLERLGDEAKLTARQMRLLMALYVQGSISQQALVRYTGATKSSNSRYIAALGDGLSPLEAPGPGLVTAEADHVDRRNNVVRLTPRGRHLMEKVAAEVAHLLDKK